MNYQTTISEDGKSYKTLSDILPESGTLQILIVGRTPSLGSVAKGHYFQGTRGKSLWRKLNKYGILKVPEGDYADDYLLQNNYGITNISEIPREYKALDEKEYRKGYERLMKLIKKYEPKLLIFAYKNALDLLLSSVMQDKVRARYGFNPDYEHIFGAAVFVFPMIGTPCTKAEAEVCMTDLVSFLGIKPA